VFQAAVVVWPPAWNAEDFSLGVYYRSTARLEFGLPPVLLIGDVAGPFTVTDPAGVFHFDWPAGINFPRPLYFQILGHSSNAGYAPGSFTNTISL